MPPMLTSRNYDYDTVQPYFLLDGEEEDFHLPPCSQLLPGPGEDFWKFELLPTPPLSPSRTPSASDVPLSEAEHLEAVSDLLHKGCDPSAAFLQSFIIQDCMWSSSFAAANQLEKIVSERLASLQTRSADQQVNTGRQQDLHTAATDCVDPSVAFPYGTLSEKSDGGAAMTSELCLVSSPLSSSDSETDEEEEDEEEEINVMTVDGRKASYPVVLKRSHVITHQHNYAALRPPAAHHQTARKRPKLESGRTAAASQSGEDEEDRRRTHNVLEKQRRTDLKRSFTALRDQIPAVARNDRAAKVAILKKATELIAKVGEEERRLLTMKKELRKRSRELRHRLEELRT